MATPPVSGAGPGPDAYRGARVYGHVAYPRMVGLHFVPGGAGDAVVLTQYDGVIYRVSAQDPPAGESRVFLDLGGRLIDGPGNEEGLLGFAFAPDFATSRRFFVYYTAGSPRRSVIARYTAPGDVADPASERVILEIPQPFSNHNGGALVFGPDGMLYVALGDGGSGGDPQGNGQNLDTILGKILRIDVSGDGYAAPPDNPFVGRGRAEIWAYGFRNPWRITFDRATGHLWAGDVGQGTWEEVDRIVRGGNYGWNVMEGPECFRAASCDQDELLRPRAAYRTRQSGTCAVTGGYVYRGNALPELRGWYVYADYCSGDVWAVDASRDAGDPVHLAATGASITSFAEAPDGELYLLTFDAGVLRLTR